MKLCHRNSVCYRALLLFASLGLLPTQRGTAGAQDKPAADLIRFLTYGSDRLEREDVRMGIFHCGQVTADLEAAKSLAKLGQPAIPEIEQELDTIETRGGHWGDGSKWLLLAYAQIKGPGAYPRLRRMEGDPKLAVLQNRLDLAVAVSLGLTSYVSGPQVLMRNIRCTRGPEPRDALDQLILAWESNDRLWLEGSLGPTARAALNSLLGGRTWAEMRAEIWKGRSRDRVAVGYWFEIPGRWSEPQETLAEETAYGAVAHSKTPDLDTRFKDSSGGDCGRRGVKFLKTPARVGPGQLMYVVDNSDLGDLLGLIASCAAKADGVR